MFYYFFLYLFTVEKNMLFCIWTAKVHEQQFLKNVALG